MACMRTKAFYKSIFAHGNNFVAKTIDRGLRNKNNYRRVDFPTPICTTLAIVDIVQAFAVTIACIVVLVMSMHDSPRSDEFRYWIFGYMVQCFLLVLWICIEQQPHYYQKFSRRMIRFIEKCEVIVYRSWWVLGCLMLFVAGSKLGLDTSKQLYRLVCILVLLELIILTVVLIVYLALVIVAYFLFPFIFGYFSVARNEDHKVAMAA
ncbi:hypothetical protein ACJIZ3_005133 [Penstemon smallii]|uniref:Transmembrane protein n=1 Tax=Penstemon smallii TaxID=265156 RepID=A0ABD3S408_9LAMI